MLIAGLFTNAAIARDGAGTVSVQWSHSEYAWMDGVTEGDRGSHALYENSYESSDGAVTRAVPIPLPAGSRENQLMFSYYTIVNMAGGEVTIELPAGWKINKAAHNILGVDDVAPADNFITADSFTTGDGRARYGDNLLVEVREDFDGVGRVIYATNGDGHHRTIDSRRSPD